MKNYLVGNLRPVSKVYGPGGLTQENVNWKRSLEIYSEMYKISRASARKYLKGNWDIKTLTTPVLDARLFMIACWYEIKGLWYNEPCNILRMGADTMFIKDTEIFDRFNDVRLFNFTEPRSHSLFPRYFNDDVFYVPSTTSQQVWKLGEEFINGWFVDSPDKDWGMGQLQSNVMFWNQDIPEEDILHPELNWTAQWFRDLDNESIERAELWNNCKLDDAHIIHLHGSRGIENTLEMMKKLADKYDIEV